MKNKQTVKRAVFSHLNSKVEIGTSIAEIVSWSRNAIEYYCLEFRMHNAHKLAPFKDATVNRYVELWLNSKVKGN